MKIEPVTEIVAENNTTIVFRLCEKAAVSVRRVVWHGVERQVQGSAADSLTQDALPHVKDDFLAQQVIRNLMTAAHN